MTYFRRIFLVINGNDVESALQIGNLVHVQISFGCTAQCLFFAECYGFFGRAVGGGIPRFHLDEHESRSVAGNDVNFSFATEMKIPFDDSIALVFRQGLRRLRLLPVDFRLAVDCFLLFP